MKAYNYIYKITNQINGKIYIGKHSTDNLDDGYMGSGILIRKAEKKYGKENFTKEYLAFCDTEEKLNWFEKFYIKKFNAREVGYNLSEGGDGFSDGHIGYWKDKCLSAEHKRKLSEAHKKHKTEEHKRKLSEVQKDKPKPKYKWLTLDNEVKIMDKGNVYKHHPDWKLIEQV